MSLNGVCPLKFVIFFILALDLSQDFVNREISRTI